MRQMHELVRILRTLRGGESGAQLARHEGDAAIYASLEAEVRKAARSGQQLVWPPHQESPEVQTPIPPR